jgi:ABC-type multidrug transport system fused ATPase/permease subunit
VRREEELQIDKETVGSDRDGTTQQSPLLTVANASFQIGLSDSIIKDAASERSSKAFHDADGFEVSDINFELRKGEILAVCGAVGSGKSTIVNGIIEEVAVAPGAAISLRGKTAYVSQTAFIMNSTLRENILFGEHFEEERYEKVLEACCLWPDIELLGEAGDLTEIGERGVTLSGGKSIPASITRSLVFTKGSDIYYD